jgi:hypothetical protein
MPILTPPPASRTAAAAVDLRIARTLWQWLALGALAVVLLPPARGDSALLGALPFWLLVVPSIGLATLYRHVLAAAWRARLVRATPRRRRRVAAVRAARPVRGALTTVRAGVVPLRHAR